MSKVQVWHVWQFKERHPVPKKNDTVKCTMCDVFDIVLTLWNSRTYLALCFHHAITKCKVCTHHNKVLQAEIRWEQKAPLFVILIMHRTDQINFLSLTFYISTRPTKARPSKSIRSRTNKQLTWWYDAFVWTLPGPVYPHPRPRTDTHKTSECL